jgi:hypothetical protein
MALFGNTFSALVDDVIDRSKRAERRADILSFGRLTIREVQVLGLFKRDLTEDAITANADPYVWTLPDRFRKMWTVEYPGMFAPNGDKIRPHFLQGPGRAQFEADYYYYPSGDSLVFAGHDGSSATASTINVAYLSYLASLAYYTTAVTHPAKFDLETLAWSYDTTIYNTAALEAVARALVTNWVLFNWFELCIEGTLAKLYKIVDDPRSVATFALYKQLQNSFLAGEGTMAVTGM